MNRLPTEKRIEILHMLVEGMSMRATSRVAGVSINTVTKLLEDAGFAAAEYHYHHVRGLRPRRIEADEIWSYCYAKRYNAAAAKSSTAGDLWTWTAIDPDTKLIVCYMVGQRDAETAFHFLTYLRSRLSGRFQLTTDGFKAYEDAVRDAFAGVDIDYAMLVKKFRGGRDLVTERRYSPTQLDYLVKVPMYGEPDMEDVSTSINERHNLTMRMSMRRFTRLTNGFSKKPENHAHMVALYALWYNFCRVHGSLKATPAQAAGLEPYAKHIRWIVDLINERAEPPRRGPYKTNISN